MLLFPDMLGPTKTLREPRERSMSLRLLKFRTCSRVIIGRLLDVTPLWALLSSGTFPLIFTGDFTMANKIRNRRRAMNRSLLRCLCFSINLQIRQKALSKGLTVWNIPGSSAKSFIGTLGEGKPKKSSDRIIG